MVQDFERPLHLDCGRSLPGFRLAYESYGRLSAEKDNAILLCHGLSGSARAAGPRGWWAAAIGPGKALDTDRFCVLCSNVLGGCGGSTGPGSNDPVTGRPWALTFPVITVDDMVRAQARLADALGIARFHSVVGGCMGGFQALTWGRLFPDRLTSMVVIGATASTSAHSLAFFEVIRQAIRSDPDWRGGNYYEVGPPTRGLRLGRLIGMLFWMSPQAMEERFGRGGAPDRGYTLAAEFAVQDFLERIGESAGGHFDPNTMLYLTRAMDYFDLHRGYASLAESLAAVRARTLLVSYRTDWRYPSHKVAELEAALQANGTEARHVVLDSLFAHGAFLYDLKDLTPVVRDFLGQRGSPQP